MLDTLLESGFDKDNFLLADIRKLTVLLETNLRAQKGIIGFGMLYKFRKYNCTNEYGYSAIVSA